MLRNISRCLETGGAIVLICMILSSCSNSTDARNTQTPGSPVGITASPDFGQITLQWNPASDADSYIVYWATNPGVNRENGTSSSIGASPFVHQSLDAGTTYYYVVTALNEAGESDASTEVSATSLDPCPSCLSGAVLMTMPPKFLDASGEIGTAVIGETISIRIHHTTNADWYSLSLSSHPAGVQENSTVVGGPIAQDGTVQISEIGFSIPNDLPSNDYVLDVYLDNSFHSGSPFSFSSYVLDPAISTSEYTVDQGVGSEFIYVGTPLPLPVLQVLPNP